MFLDQKILSFITVCEKKGITRAANYLNLTQPAVTNQIKELERELGVKLFFKSGRELSPTPEAMFLYQKFRVMKNDTDSILHEIKNFHQRSITYNFGATMTIGEYVIPSPLARLLKDDTDCKANLVIANTDKLITDLLEGKINFALIEGNFSQENLEVRKFSTVPFIGVCNKKHKFDKEVISLDSLLGECLVCRESGSGTRNILEARLEQENLSISSFKETVEVYGMHAILLMLKEDLGISFMYEPASREAIEEGILKEIPIDNFSVFHDFSFVWQKGSMYEREYEQFFLKLKMYTEKMNIIK